MSSSGLPHAVRPPLAAALALAVSACAPARTVTPATTATDTAAARTALAATRVTASRREVRIVFPAETLAARHPVRPGAETTHRTHGWSARFEDGDRPWLVSVSAAEVPDLPPATVADLAPRMQGCRSLPGPVAYCETEGVIARVVGGRVELVLRDTAVISGVLGLRPASVRVARCWPGRGECATASVAIHYVAPQIPTPDSATHRRIAEGRRAYRASYTSATRRIAAPGRGANGAETWVAVGDSIRLVVEEEICLHDLCGFSRGLVTDSAWVVEDSSVVQVLRQEDPRGVMRRTFRGRPQILLRALREGRTRVSVAGLQALPDTFPLRDTLPSRLWREVVVTAPPARIVIHPRPDTVPAGVPIAFEVRVLDAQGRTLAGAPASLEIWGEGPRGLYTAAEPMRLRFSGTGKRMLTTSYGPLADTLHLNVRAPGP